MDAKAQAILSFDGLEKANDKLIADLKAIDPPEEVESLHKQLLSEMQQFQVQVKDAAASLTASDGRRSRRLWRNSQPTRSSSGRSSERRSQG